jgi:3'-phosphoadenosine 5'-phosphosulfate (PAPS) 3'-phosphatase
MCGLEQRWALLRAFQPRPATPTRARHAHARTELGGSAGGASGRHWVLDPIDGTRGFVGGRQYAVCLGLLDEGEVVLGVLGCPNLPLSEVTDADGGAGACATRGVGGSS